MYGFTTKFIGTYEEAITRVTEELAKEGFGILTEIDVKATLKKKLNVDKRPYIILGACNPVLANKAISAEPDIGLLLPCNVVVREEEDNSITIAFMDPQIVLDLVQQPNIHELASEVKAKLERVRDGINA